MIRRSGWSQMRADRFAFVWYQEMELVNVGVAFSSFPIVYVGDILAAANRQDWGRFELATQQLEVGEISYSKTNMALDFIGHRVVEIGDVEIGSIMGKYIEEMNEVNSRISIAKPAPPSRKSARNVSSGNHRTVSRVSTTVLRSKSQCAHSRDKPGGASQDPREAKIFPTRYNRVLSECKNMMGQCGTNLY